MCVQNRILLMQTTNLQIIADTVRENGVWLVFWTEERTQRGLCGGMKKCRKVFERKGR